MNPKPPTPAKRMQCPDCTYSNDNLDRYTWHIKHMHSNAAPTTPAIDYPIKLTPVDVILVDFADKHNKGFYGNGTPKDAIRIKKEARAKLDQFYAEEILRLAKASLLNEVDGKGNNIKTDLISFSTLRTAITKRWLGGNDE